MHCLEPTDVILIFRWSKLNEFIPIKKRLRYHFELEILQFKTSICNLRKESDCQIFWRWMSVTQFVQFIYLVAFLVLLPRLNKRENIHWFQSYKWCEDNHWNKTILNAVKIRVMIINTNCIRDFLFLLTALKSIFRFYFWASYNSFLFRFLESYLYLYSIDYN